MDAFADGINGIDKRFDTLSSNDRALFERLYCLSMQNGCIVIPSTMKEWAARQFGSLEAIASQRIIRVTNLITGEETIYNNLRKMKPSDTREKDAVVIDSIDMGVDSFAAPLENTTADTFGRIEGRHCVTASNIAKCDELHGLIIFRHSHPLHWNREEIIDYIDTGWRWARKAHEHYPANRYYFFCWNCLWRSGASINHGHAQMTLSRGRAYTRIESLRKVAQAYRRKYKTDYFDDLFKVHESLGLAFEKSRVRLLACLTPVKNSEIVILSDRLDNAFGEMVYEALSLYRDTLGITSFNLAVITPPLDKTRENWQGFPVMARMVDRGNLNYRSSDIGSLELFAANAVGSDPFKLAQNLGMHLRKEKHE